MTPPDSTASPICCLLHPEGCSAALGLGQDGEVISRALGQLEPTLDPGPGPTKPPVLHAGGQATTFRSPRQPLAGSLEAGACAEGGSGWARGPAAPGATHSIRSLRLCGRARPPGTGALPEPSHWPCTPPDPPSSELPHLKIHTCVGSRDHIMRQTPVCPARQWELPPAFTGTMTSDL